MTTTPESLPSDLAAAHAMILAERAARLSAEADRLSGAALIAHLKLQIEKLRRELYGTRSERAARLIDQMELELEELEATATEQAVAAQAALARTLGAGLPPRHPPSRKPFPAHLPRERVLVPAPECCPCCGSAKLSKLGQDITETLEVIPRTWKVIQTVRERFSCRACETVTQPPAPFHVTPRGFAGPHLLATILFEKFGQHQPLNRQSERFAREGIALSVSTLADQVGACTAALAPLHTLIAAHVLAAGRLHGDDTTVPILAKGRTITGRIWTYVRDDRPFGGLDPPAALFYASRDRAGEHPEAHLRGYRGILQADAYSGIASTIPHARKARSARRSAGLMPAAGSLSSPTVAERLAQLEAQNKTLEARLGQQERVCNIGRKVLLGALVLQHLHASHDPAFTQRLADGLRRELPGFLTHGADRALFDDLFGAHTESISDNDAGPDTFPA
ncbi:Transposase [Methylobacterium sp. 13MFTsu3.1M2]|nr:Transposase [Methylobacterium sp. 13MFTsu3.1M2]